MKAIRPFRNCYTQFVPAAVSGNVHRIKCDHVHYASVDTQVKLTAARARFVPREGMHADRRKETAPFAGRDTKG